LVRNVCIGEELVNDRQQQVTRLLRIISLRGLL
jgi:hypothetical protein